MQHSTPLRKTLAVILSAALLLCAVPSAFASGGSAAYAVNANGETYGSDLQAQALGCAPALLLAVGEDGTCGYVRAEDLDDGVSVPAYAQSAQRDRIPLYASDGETVIGSFALQPSDMCSSDISSERSVMSPPGYTGYGYAKLSVSSVTATARTDASTSITVSAGWIGTQARLYRASDGALLSASDWSYNTAAAASHSATTTYYTLSDIEVYSRGQIKLWNSEISDYWTYWTHPTVSVSM